MIATRQRELVLVVSCSTRCRVASGRVFAARPFTAQAHPRGWPECAGGARQTSGSMLFGANEHHAHPASTRVRASKRDGLRAMRSRGRCTSRSLSWAYASSPIQARPQSRNESAPGSTHRREGWETGREAEVLTAGKDRHPSTRTKGDRSARLQLVDGVRSEVRDLVELPTIIAAPNDGGDAWMRPRAAEDSGQPLSALEVSRSSECPRSLRSRDGVERHALRPDGHALRGLGIPTRRAMVAQRDRSQRGGFDSRTGLQRRSRWIAR
jgi:hypothetical protein